MDDGKKMLYTCLILIDWFDDEDQYLINSTVCRFPRYLWPLFSFCFKHSSGFEQWVRVDGKKDRSAMVLRVFQHRNDAAIDEPLALQYEKYRKKRCRFRVLILTFFGAFWPKKFGGKLDPLLSNGSKFILSTVMHMSINNRWRHWDNHNFTRIFGLITFR